MAVVVSTSMLRRRRRLSSLSPLTVSSSLLKTLSLETGLSLDFGFFLLRLYHIIILFQFDGHLLSTKSCLYFVFRFTQTQTQIFDRQRRRRPNSHWAITITQGANEMMTTREFPMRRLFIFAFKNVSRTLSDFARAMWIGVVRAAACGYRRTKEHECVTRKYLPKNYVRLICWASWDAMRWQICKLS